jgi:anti-sigma factor RsiW
MDACGDYTVDLMLYMDDELDGEKLMGFLAHLKICAHCQASLEEQLALSATLHRVRPLYSAPPELRARVKAGLARPEARSAPGRIYQRVARTLKLALPHAGRLVPRWKILVPAVLGMMLCFVLVSSEVRDVRASEYVNAAVSAHRDYLDGHLSLQIRTDSPAAVTGWLAQKVAFPLQLPDSQRQPDGKPAYRLLGATLVDYNGSQAGLVTYAVPQKESISLLVASNKSAVIGGGVEVRSGDLIFHHRVDQGFQVITWSNHGMAYALVSRATGSAYGSCLICHQSMPDPDRFQRVP